MDRAVPSAGPDQNHSRVAPNPVSQPAGKNPSVAILMCTLNGDTFLQEQLDSIGAQTHQNWRLFVSDDDSVDELRAEADITEIPHYRPDAVSVCSHTTCAFANQRAGESVTQ